MNIFNKETTAFGRIFTVITGLLYNLIWVNFISGMYVLVGLMPSGTGLSLYQILDTRKFLVEIFFGDIWAPLWEELAFRWAPITLVKLWKEQALWPIIIISTGIFSWGHGHGPYSVLLQGGTGIILSIVYLRNGYWSAVLVHALSNLALDFIP